MSTKNLLKLKYNTVITDMGLCKPADYNTSENNVYGILPYVAPEPKLYQAGI
uniref:Protein kinase domain-containing protein n=1 Tax=Rhizophagus irregularis (strain DAOM 181602 / DAOM 197198 / MUCL 43194) TaxID=747089 RepID=U9UGI0_RHIID